MLLSMVAPELRPTAGACPEVAGSVQRCSELVARGGLRGAGVAGVLSCACFFQAEDGIRDADVTGVQTCALPISVWIRMVLDSLTLPNGYTVALSATPNSADPNSRASVDREGRITGPSGVGKDVGTVGLAAFAGGLEGGYVGLLARAPFRQSVAIGHGAGAAIGLAVVLLPRGPEAEVSAGTTLDVVFDQPLTLDADHLPANGPGTPPAPFPRPARPEEKNKIHHRRPPLFPFLWPRVSSAAARGGFPF